MIVIVVGMHRSGTSALAGMLHGQGIVMGERRRLRPRPSVENPRGFYENIRFRRLSDRMLRESSYRVKSWDPAIPLIHATRLTRYRVRRLLSRYDRRYPVWGWKDPRVCLTLDVWLDELDRLRLRDQVKLLYIFRPPASVARSMVERGNATYERAMSLWTAYNQRALDAIDKTPVARLFVGYDELCHRSSDVAATDSRFLNVPHDPEMVDAFIDPRLNRSATADDQSIVAPEVADHARAIEATLHDRLTARPS